MFRFICPALFGIFLITNVLAQSPSPSPSSPARPPTPTKSPATPVPSPVATPTTEELINSLGQVDLQAVISLLKSNFTNPDALSDLELNRATVQGLITVLIDGETAGAAEALAGALRICDKALIIGQTTAGRAVEYSDLSLPSGKFLRVAVAEAALAEDQKLFPDGVKPDLPVEMSMMDKRQIFQLSAEKGMGPFVSETERPHMNEAALIAGTNPEVDAAEAAQRRRERGADKPAVHDLVLQRALDLVTSLEIYQKR